MIVPRAMQAFRARPVPPSRARLCVHLASQRPKLSCSRHIARAEPSKYDDGTTPGQEGAELEIEDGLEGDDLPDVTSVVEVQDDGDVVEPAVDAVQKKRADRETRFQLQRRQEGRGRGGREEDKYKDFEDRIISVNRVTKVLKGGKLMKFRAVVVAGNRKGTVGYGVASAREIADAVNRASTIARKESVRVPIVGARTVPHKIQVKEGASRVMLRPASDGTGVIAGGSVRVVLELAGYQNCFGKIYGTGSAMNNVRGTLTALTEMFTWDMVAAKRGVTIDYAMGRVDEPNQVYKPAQETAVTA